MRRCLALIFCGLALSLAACGSSSPHAWIAHPRVFTACGSADCGPAAVTLNWSSIPLPGRTGYYVYLNGTQVADVNASRYTFYGLDCGTTFQIGTRAHDGSGNLSGLVSTSYTSPACVGNAAPANTVLPVISGASTQGQTLSVSNGTWSGLPTSFSYQWQRCAITCSTINGAAASTYTLALADVGDSIQVIVTATNASGSTPATSARTATIIGGGTFTANLYVTPASAGNGGAACTKSASLINYNTALANGNVCHSMYKACQIAAGGIVGFKAGNYPDVPGGSDASPFFLPNGEDGLASDCGSAANAINPNSVEQGTGAVATPTGWATFECADGEAGTAQFSADMSSGPNIYIDGNPPNPAGHVIFDGGCFSFWNVNVGIGDTGLRASNIIFQGDARRISFKSMSVVGAENIWFNHYDLGPFNLCYHNGDTSYLGVPVTSAEWCSTTVATTGESFYNKLTSSQLVSIYPFAPRISNSVDSPSFNIRAQDGIAHDVQSRSATLHSVCAYILNNSGGAADQIGNIVFDGLKCIRNNVAGLQIQNSNGITVENSQFGVVAEPMINTGKWFQANAGAPGVTMDCHQGFATITNVVIRYNSSVGPMEGFTTALDGANHCTSFTNTYLIGNVSLGGFRCLPGWTLDYNVTGNSGANCGGTNSSIAGSPFTTDIRADIAYPPSASDVLAANPGFDATPSAALPTVPNGSGNNLLDHDYNGAARSNPTKAGAVGP